MEPYGPQSYGDRIADLYDDWYADRDEGMVDLLTELAGDGPALELGIGTGRVALALAERGVSVSGIDASRAMVERLRAKPGGDCLPVALGDFADVAVEGSFALVYVVFNTFFALLSQQDQLRCFRSVAGRLRPGGAFALEVFMPDPSRFTRGQATYTTRLAGDAVLLESSRHDPATQRVSSQHVLLTEAGIRLIPVEVRYAWPSELDLMAQLAGLRLRDRWGGWQREPFTAASPKHISVYELSPDLSRP